MTCRPLHGSGDKCPTPGDKRRGAAHHLLRPRCDAHAAEHILPGKIDTQSAAERLHRRPRTGRHTARRPRLTMAISALRTSTSRHTAQSFIMTQRPVNTGTPPASGTTPKMTKLLIQNVGTEDRRTITGTRDMATNAPATERPVCWLLLFHSAQTEQMRLHHAL